jgi:hypothetical protein
MDRLACHLHVCISLGEYGAVYAWIRLAGCYPLHVLQSIYMNENDESCEACVEQKKDFLCCCVSCVCVSVSHRKG